MSAATKPISIVKHPRLKFSQYPKDPDRMAESFIGEIRQAHELSKNEALSKAKTISESSLKSLFASGPGRSSLLRPLLAPGIATPTKTMAAPMFTHVSGAAPSPHYGWGPPPYPLPAAVTLAPPYNYGWPNTRIKHIDQQYLVSLADAHPADGRMEVGTVASPEIGEVDTPFFNYSGALAAIATWVDLPPLSKAVEVTVSTNVYVHGSFYGMASNDSIQDQPRRIFIESAVTLHAAPFLNGQFEPKSIRQNLYWKILGAVPGDAVLWDLKSSITSTLTLNLTVPESCPILVGVSSEALTISTRYGQPYDCFGEVDLEGYSLPQPADFSAFPEVTISPCADGNVFVPNIGVSWKEI